MKTRGIEVCWIHDAVNVAVLIDPTTVASSSYIVDVALEGSYTRGTSRGWKKEAIRLSIGMPKN